METENAGRLGYYIVIGFTSFILAIIGESLSYEITQEGFIYLGITLMSNPVTASITWLAIVIALEVFIFDGNPTP